MNEFFSQILNPDRPHDKDIHEAQRQYLVQHLFYQKETRCLELGSGGGRIIEILLRAGSFVVGIDRDLKSIENLKEKFSNNKDNLKLYVSDFLEDGFSAINLEENFNMITLLGNTMMEALDIASMLRLFKQCYERLKPDGIFVIDDIPGLFWPSVAEGFWQNGISEEGDIRLAWDLRDQIFTLRFDGSVNDEAPPRPFERKFRLWTGGEIELLAWSSGFKAPKTAPGVLVMKRPAI